MPGYRVVKFHHSDFDLTHSELQQLWASLVPGWRPLRRHTLSTLIRLVGAQDTVSDTPEPHMIVRLHHIRLDLGPFLLHYCHLGILLSS